MMQQPLVSVRLLCGGNKAEAGSSLQQQKNKSSVSERTQSATVVYRVVKRPPDGKHDASYEGRRVHRDVYRIGDITMKLSTDVREAKTGNNRLEAAALKKQTIFNRLHVCFLNETALQRANSFATLESNALRRL